jgi:hypothetical protein
LFKSPDSTPFRVFFFVGLDKERSLAKERWIQPVELLARILDAAVCVKKRKDQLGRTTSDLCTQVAECIEVGCEILEHLL